MDKIKLKKVYFLLKEDYNEHNKWIMPEYKDKLHKVIEILLGECLEEWQKDMFFEFLYEESHFKNIDECVIYLFKEK